MKEEYMQIEILLARFFDGLTSNEEEQQLYCFFNRDDVPEVLERYKSVMKYFESGLIDELKTNKISEFYDDIVEKNELPASEAAGFQHPASKALSSITKRWIIWSGVAASFLLILFTSLYKFSTQDTLDAYAGSYIIRNGIRITDLNRIKPELEAAVQKSLLLEQEADRLIERISEIDDSQELQIMQEMNNHNQRIWDAMRDDNIHKESDEILTTH